MRNIIYKICERLRGYSNDTEYFEVVRAYQAENGNYFVEICLIKPEVENEGNE